MIERIDVDLNFLFNIVFSDKITFELNDQVNRYNFRYWNDNNPYGRIIVGKPYSISTKIKCLGVCSDVLIGPFFIDDDLTEEKYEAMLRNQIFPIIRLQVKILSRYQQDGAPPYYDKRYVLIRT